MALRIVKAASDTGVYQRGIEFNEVAIVVRRFSVRYYPEVDRRIKDHSEQTFVRVQSRFFSRDIVCEGEVRGASPNGIMGFTLGVALTYGNDITVFKDRADNNVPINPRGTVVLDDATEAQDRTGWRSVSVRASSNPLL